MFESTYSIWKHLKYLENAKDLLPVVGSGTKTRKLFWITYQNQKANTHVLFGWAYRIYEQDVYVWCEHFAFLSPIFAVSQKVI